MLKLLHAASLSLTTTLTFSLWKVFVPGDEARNTLSSLSDICASFVGKSDEHTITHSMLVHIPGSTQIAAPLNERNVEKEAENPRLMVVLTMHLPCILAELFCSHIYKNKLRMANDVTHISMDQAPKELHSYL